MVTITPFHFICHTEERLRAQMGALDPQLDAFVEIHRRFNLEKSDSQLQFGAKPDLGEDFTPHAVFKATLVPQKENKVAFNCTFTCPAEDMDLSFRLLMRRPEEMETQIIKVMEMLQKAFGPMDYKSKVNIETPVAAPSLDDELDEISEEEMAAILDTGGSEKNPDAYAPTMDEFNKEMGGGLKMGGAEEEEKLSMEDIQAQLGGGGIQVEKPEAKKEDASTNKKKYYVENVHDGDEVRLKDASGAYVPAGDLPAKLKINKADKE